MLADSSFITHFKNKIYVCVWESQILGSDRWKVGSKLENCHLESRVQTRKLSFFQENQGQLFQFLLGRIALLLLISKIKFMCGWESQILGRDRWKSRAKARKTVIVIFPGKSEKILPILSWKE